MEHFLESDDEVVSDEVNELATDPEGEVVQLETDLEDDGVSEEVDELATESESGS